MSDEDDKPLPAQSEGKELARWMDIINERKGYGGMFARKTARDKAIIECSVMDEWANAMDEAFGIDVAAVRQNPDDPPDFFARIGDEDVLVELVELINQRQVARVMSKVKSEDPCNGQLFLDAQWTRDRFEREVSAVICKKAEDYERRSIRVDALVIYTGEPWLSPAMVAQWNSEISFKPHSSICSAQLLMEYAPGYAKHWPLFWLFGELAGQG